MQADYVLDYDVVAAGRERRLYLLARIKGGPQLSQTKRPPLNLAVVLDRSGSMAGDKLDYVKKATRFLVQHLGADDRLSLVTYDSNVNVEFPPTTVVFKDRINQAIDKIQSGSSTNLSGGWLQGCALVESAFAEGQVNRVLLLTDGLANEGITDPNHLCSMAKHKRDKGVTTTTMGVGMDFNEDLLVRMARDGGGAFYFIDDPDRAPHIFREELHDLLNVVGQNLTVTLKPSADVRIVSQFNAYPTMQHGDAMAYRLGDIFADEVKVLLLELSIPPIDKLGQIEIARLRFDYDELSDTSAAHQADEVPIFIYVAADETVRDSRANDDVVRTALLLKATHARQQSVAQADKGDYEGASRVLSAIADEIANSPAPDDPELARQHDMLREEAVDMELGAQRYDDYSRKAAATKVVAGFETRAMKLNESYSQHSRMKSSRHAVERKGAAPTLIRWRKESLPLGDEPIRIGRHEDSDIVVDEEQVSKVHCQIMREGDKVYLEDLNSTNGTFANGGRVKDRFRLTVGDVVTVGNVLFTFS